MNIITRFKYRAQRQARGYAGFTLLEMTIVIVIISIVAISLVAMFSASLQKLQYQQTVVKMQTIQTALRNFRFAHNRLPCPADATIVGVGTLNFGIEGANPGTCTGGVPAANYSEILGSINNIEGMVPTKTLELPDDYAIDGWGRRIMYAVSSDLTQNGAFSIVNAFDGLTRMIIKNGQGTNITIHALEVLVSFGANGHGAFPRYGGLTRVNAGSVNVDELNNCDCSNAGVYTAFNGTFVQKDVLWDPANALDNFDDLVFFTSRSNYILPSNIIGQPFTFSAAGAGADNPTTCQGGIPLCTESGGIKQCVCGY